MKFYVLQRDFSVSSKQFQVFTIEAESDEKAWEKVEEEISVNMSQDWLMDKKQWGELQQVIKETNANRKRQTAKIPGT